MLQTNLQEGKERRERRTPAAMGPRAVEMRRGKAPGYADAIPRAAKAAG